MDKTKNRQQNKTTSAEDETKIITKEKLVEEMDLSDVNPRNSDNNAEKGDTKKLEKKKPDVSEKGMKCNFTYVHI